MHPLPCRQAFLEDYGFDEGDGSLDRVINDRDGAANDGICTGYPVTIRGRWAWYALDMGEFVATPQFLSLLVVPVSALMGMLLVRWVIGKRSLTTIALRVRAMGRWIRPVGVGLLARRRSLGVCVVVLAALWIFQRHAENGRFHLSADRRTMLDTRTGATYWRSDGRWVEWAAPAPR